MHTTYELTMIQRDRHEALLQEAERERLLRSAGITPRIGGLGVRKTAEQVRAQAQQVVCAVLGARATPACRKLPTS
jgi:hypothetical protein